MSSTPAPMVADQLRETGGDDLPQPLKPWWSLPLTTLVILLILLLRRK